ncbi:MAG: hypothetical protein J0I12_32490 [Candidatus Eremiobacteraeota bacterium]|nr:hypothetical protein [Candidatus Eremiobacteraeota bacterium]
MKRAHLLLACWVGVALVSHLLVGEHRRLEPRKPIIRYQDLFLDLLGEGRTLLARLVWFQADLYHEQQDSAGVAVFQQKEVIPLLRMVTYLDPSFADAYDTIAYDLDEGFGQTRQAIDLVEEGLLYSPESYALNFRRAFLADKQRDSVSALLYGQRAYDSTDADTNQFLAAKLMRRASLRMRDPWWGIQVVDLLIRLRVPDPDAELTRIWHDMLQGKGVKTGSGPAG